jgi:ABC-type transport system involved in multi-copper enzyme maturation permease subunit
MLCAMVASVDMGGALAQVMQFAPPLLRALIEQQLGGGSPAMVLAFGWNHPVAHALMSAVAIALAARAIAGEVEHGAIELVLAQPLSRGAYFAAYAAFGLAALAALIGAGVAATAVGQRVFALEPFGAARLAALFANALLLQLAIYGLTLLASAVGREAGRVALFGVLVAVLSYLVNAIATLWPRAAFARPASLHAYFEPRELLVDGRLAAHSALVLGGVALAALALAWRRFGRRDLP